MKKLMLLLLIPCALQAQIFRCESKGEAYFSQIPCEENSEAVLIEDQLMFSEAPQGGVAEVIPEKVDLPVEPLKTPADNMQTFVATLQRQRTEQLQNIGQDIDELEAQLNSEDETSPDDGEKDLAQAKMAGLQAARTSVEKEYESMIAEAERRVIALSRTE